MNLKSMLCTKDKNPHLLSIAQQPDARASVHIHRYTTLRVLATSFLQRGEGGVDGTELDVRVNDRGSGVVGLNV